MQCANQTDKYHCNKNAIEGSKYCSTECEHAFKQLQYHAWNNETMSMIKRELNI